MGLDKIEINGLKDILKELDNNIKEYSKLKETGNSKGEHKDIYFGKHQAYDRSRTILIRWLKWHSILEIASEGEYLFKASVLPVSGVVKSVCSIEGCNRKRYMKSAICKHHFDGYA